MHIRTPLAMTLATAALSTVLAAPALAYTPRPQNGTCDKGEICLFYNSNLKGSMSDFYGDQYNFSPKGKPFLFLTPGAGKGKPVKNNAASVLNKSWFCHVRVYENSHYMGRSDEIPDDDKRNLRFTKNNNASFKWNCSGW